MALLQIMIGDDIPYTSSELYKTIQTISSWLYERIVNAHNLSLLSQHLTRHKYDKQYISSPNEYDYPPNPHLVVSQWI